MKILHFLILIIILIFIMIWLDQLEEHTKILAHAIQNQEYAIDIIMDKIK